MKKMKLLYNKYKEIINYLIVGGLTTFIGVGSKLLLLFTCFDQTNGIQLQIAEIISWVLAVTFAYYANKIFVFYSSTKGKDSIKEAFNFVKGRIFTQIIQMVIMWFFVTLLKLNTDVWVIIFTLICQILQIVLNYVISKIFVFKNK